MLRASVSSQQVEETHVFPQAESISRVEWVGAREARLIAVTLDTDGLATSACWKAGGQDPLWQTVGSVAVDGRRMLVASVSRDGDVVLSSAEDGSKLRQWRPYSRGARWR